MGAHRRLGAHAQRGPDRREAADSYKGSDLDLYGADMQQSLGFFSPTGLMPKDGPVTMRIYAIDGRLVRTLKNGESTVAGTYEVRWNGVNDQGRHVPSGVYFVKIWAEHDGDEVKRVTILK